MDDNNQLNGIGVVLRETYWDLEHPYVHQTPWQFVASKKWMETSLVVAGFIPFIGSVLTVENMTDSRTVLTTGTKTFLSGFVAALGSSPQYANFAGDILNLFTLGNKLGSTLGAITSGAGGAFSTLQGFKAIEDISQIWATEGQFYDTLKLVEASGLAVSDDKELTIFLAGYLTVEFGMMLRNGEAAYQKKVGRESGLVSELTSFELTKGTIESDNYKGIVEKVKAITQSWVSQSSGGGLMAERCDAK